MKEQLNTGLTTEEHIEVLKKKLETNKTKYESVRTKIANLAKEREILERKILNQETTLRNLQAKARNDEEHQTDQLLQNIVE